MITRLIITTIVLVLLSVVFFSMPAASAPGDVSATLSWTAPTTRTDGTALISSEIQTYRLYYGELSTNLTEMVDVGNVVTYNFTPPSPGVALFLAVTVVDTDNVESEFSNVIDWLNYMPVGPSSAVINSLSRTREVTEHETLTVTW